MPGLDVKPGEDGEVRRLYSLPGGGPYSSDRLNVFTRRAFHGSEVRFRLDANVDSG